MDGAERLVAWDECRHTLEARMEREMGIRPSPGQTQFTDEIRESIRNVIDEERPRPHSPFSSSMDNAARAAALREITRKRTRETSRVCYPMRTTLAPFVVPERPRPFLLSQAEWERAHDAAIDRRAEHHCASLTTAMTAAEFHPPRHLPLTWNERDVHVVNQPTRATSSVLGATGIPWTTQRPKNRPPAHGKNAWLAAEMETPRGYRKIKK